jgi:hypothetical protein
MPWLENMIAPISSKSPSLGSINSGWRETKLQAMPLVMLKPQPMNAKMAGKKDHNPLGVLPNFRTPRCLMKEGDGVSEMKSEPQQERDTAREQSSVPGV